MRAALLIVEPVGVAGAAGEAGDVERVLGLFRDNGLPVVWMAAGGSRGSVDCPRALPEESRILGDGNGKLDGSDLAELLERLDVDVLVMAGGAGMLTRPESDGLELMPVVPRSAIGTGRVDAGLLAGMASYLTSYRSLEETCQGPTYAPAREEGSEQAVTAPLTSE